MSERAFTNPRRALTGFTLLEVLIVTAVIGVLAAIVLITMGDGADSARREVAKRFERTLESGAAMYIAQTGKVPSSFYGWVAFGSSGSQMNFVRVDAPLRLELADPQADVMIGGNASQLRLVFPGNLIATYNIDSSGKVTMTMTP